MYKRITIIGLGTLGGFLAKSISNIEEVEQFTLIDYDHVEERNLKNQIYSMNDIGKLKTEALFNILKSKKSNLKLRRVSEKYVEGITKIPPTDLVIDCRDFTYDRGSKIDVRLYISSRYLIIDCRKNVKFEKHHEGIYTSSLTKSDLEYATMSFSNLINLGFLKGLISKQILHKVYLDCIKEDIDNTITKLEDFDIVMDSYKGDHKLLNQHEFNEILKSNLQYNTVLCLGERKNSLIEQEYPKNSLVDINMLMENMLSLISKTNPITVYQNYIISQKIIDNTCYVELLPETGAA